MLGIKKKYIFKTCLSQRLKNENDIKNIKDIMTVEDSGSKRINKDIYLYMKILIQIWSNRDFRAGRTFNQGMTSVDREQHYIFQNLETRTL